jgi:hypothetical protein
MLLAEDAWSTCAPQNTIATSAATLNAAWPLWPAKILKIAERWIMELPVANELNQLHRYLKSVNTYLPPYHRSRLGHT